MRQEDDKQHDNAVVHSITKSGRNTERMVTLKFNNAHQRNMRNNFNQIHNYRNGNSSVHQPAPGQSDTLSAPLVSRQGDKSFIFKSTRSNTQCCASKSGDIEVTTDS